MRLPSRPRLAPVAALFALAMAGACSNERAGDTARFCTDIGVNRDAIVAPQLTTQADIDAHLTIYRDLAEDTPLEIDEHWEALVLAYETMSTVDPDDAESEQVALARMYATQPSAIAVHDWVRETCQVDLGPVATVAVAPPGATVPATTPITDGG